MKGSSIPFGVTVSFVTNLSLRGVLVTQGSGRRSGSFTVSVVVRKREDSVSKKSLNVRRLLMGDYIDSEDNVMAHRRMMEEERTSSKIFRMTHPMAFRLKIRLPAGMTEPVQYWCLNNEENSE